MAPPKKKSYPSADYLRERLKYDPKSGKLFWRDCPEMPAAWRAKFSGQEAFTTMQKNGYRSGSIDNTRLLAHRVIWAMQNGEWPDCDVDHVNGSRADNRLSNLRAVTRSENMRNASMRTNNTSGCVGVVRHHSGRWIAQIKHESKNVYLGIFADKQDAARARKAAEVRFGYSERHGEPQ